MSGRPDDLELPPRVRSRKGAAVECSQARRAQAVIERQFEHLTRQVHDRSRATDRAGAVSAAAGALATSPLPRWRIVVVRPPEERA